MEVIIENTGNDGGDILTLNKTFSGMAPKVQYLTQNELLMRSILAYYAIDKLDIMVPIINGKSRISLRILDWFVTNYSKKHGTVYLLKQPNGDHVRFKVYGDYKLRLKSYSKKRFDPFCRWERVNIPYTDNMYIETTLGQLNFFRWVIDNKILNYIEDHYETIENDMNQRNSNGSAKRSLSATPSPDVKSFENKSFSTNSVSSEDDDTITNKTRKKREELSVCASKSFNKEDVNVVIKFN